jgi:hypothetical protein
MTPSLPKWGLGSLSRLPKLQSSIAVVKTPCIDVFFISLKIYQSLDVEMGLHEPFGHLQHKLWQKERPGVKLAIWLPTIKSQESTRLQCVQVECDTPLESSWWRPQLCFRPHCDQRLAQEVMRFQSRGTFSDFIVIRGRHRKLCALKVAGVPAIGISRLPLGSLETKNHLDATPVESCRVYYMGEGDGFPRVRVVVSLVSPKLLVARPSTKGVPESELTNLWLVRCRFEWVIEKLVTLPNPIQELQHTPLPLLVLRAGNVPRTSNNSAVWPT